ncbi:unnamed protein product [Mytilus coruscus]|uniref:Uncharacterized protein n=1 Tax=Mytilus coruscus TaxID=42192 RepID=A0A6J8A9W0_MYTCO|nr:unnamed protein product [Mytilus coruscus]
MIDCYVCLEGGISPRVQTGRNIPTETTRQLTEFLDASMPDFSDLLGVEPRTPSPMRQLLNEEPPPEAVIPSDQLFSKYLSPDIDFEKTEPSALYFTSSMNNFQEQAESSSLNLNTTVSNIQEPAEPAPLDFTTSITNNQEPAELSPSEIILDLSFTRNTASTLDNASTIDTASTLDITTSSNTNESTASPKEPTI